MKTSDFDYNLSDGFIANTPASPRDHSKLLVVNRKDNSISHKYFYNIVDYLDQNDVLVLNNTKVFPARFFGKKETGGKIEVLLIEEVEKNVWKALTKPGIKLDQKIYFEDIVFTAVKHEEQTVYLKSSKDKTDVLSTLQQKGITPLPPYIHSDQTEDEIRRQYQTVYAKFEGSVAAPTAGFHFTDELLDKLKNKGVQIEYVTLHVELGTFAPVKSENLEDHPMHYEYFEIEEETAKRLKDAKKSGKRIVSVGTTTTRVLESMGDKLKGSTNLFIYPPYKFKFVDALITNFHLPKSTLLSLVSALVSYPNTDDKFIDFKNSLIGKAYEEAIKNKYRFYSFGDASIII